MQKPDAGLKTKRWRRIAYMGSTAKLQIFTGNANPALAKEIADHLGLAVGKMKVHRFQDGEIDLHIEETVRGARVFLIQPTCVPSNENIMELLIMIDACRRASAREIDAVIPYYGYARKDRKTAPRDPISAKLVANLLTAAGADRILTMDLHAGQIQGFFDIPVDNLRALPIIAEYLEHKQLSHPVVVAPDVGGVARARELAHRLDCGLAIIDKRRPEANVAEVMHVIGDVGGRTAILIDDIIDTAGTITQGAEALVAEGAEGVYACATHAVFSESAIDKMKKAPFREIIVTNTIPVSPAKRLDNMRILSVAQLFAEAIHRVHEELSVSKLFD